MELTYQWFWIVQYTVLATIFYSSYKAVVVNKAKSKVWNVVAIALLVIGYMSPIKMEPTTNQTNSRTDQQIAITKMLPAKQVDDSFKQNAVIQKITKEDLK